MERTAIVYARVSTREQAEQGYSLRQQIEACRAWCEAEGYEVAEEVEDAGYSGASLERPGIDRVRDLVAAGGVSVVVAQDRDRFAREPAYHYLLREEFAACGCAVRSLNNRGDDSPEGQLTDGIMDQIARFERLKIVERTRRGLLRRVKEGNVIRRSKAPYGFDFSEDGKRLLVSEQEMAVVRRLFHELAAGRTAGAVVRGLGADGVPSPAGGLRWNQRSIALFLKSDLYLPRPAGEVAHLVEPQVAATLDAERVYGLWEFGRRETRRWKERDDITGEYRTRHSDKIRPPEQRLRAPVDLSGSGLDPRTVLMAREMAKDRAREPSNAAGRFWQLTGIIRCGECGSAMSAHHAKRYLKGGGLGKPGLYYNCRRRHGDGTRFCDHDTNYRAAQLEESVWEAVLRIASEPAWLLGQYERHAERQRRQMRGDPDAEVLALAEQLRKLERRRDGYLDLAADGDMGREELRGKLADVDERRQGLREALKEAERRQESLRQPRINMAHLNSVLLQLHRMDPAMASPEDRRRLYDALRLRVTVDPDRTVRLSGVFDPDVYLPGVLEGGPDWLTGRPGARERYETVVASGSTPLNASESWPDNLAGSKSPWK